MYKCIIVFNEYLISLYHYTDKIIPITIILIINMYVDHRRLNTCSARESRDAVEAFGLMADITVRSTTMGICDYYLVQY